jgi:zinc transporter 2
VQVVEIIGGFYAGSLAIMTDAAHLLTDVAAMLLSLFAMWLTNRPANSKSSFGYHRAEIIGALFSVLTIWGLVGVLAYEAILRLIADSKREGRSVASACVKKKNEKRKHLLIPLSVCFICTLLGDPVDGKVMTIIGCLGLGVNIIDAFILWWGNAPHGHSHAGGGGHGHSHGGGSHAEKKKKSTSVSSPGEHGHSHEAGSSSGGHGHSHEAAAHGHSHEGREHGHSHEAREPAPSHEEGSGKHGHSHEGGDHGHSHAKKKDPKSDDYDEEDDV